MIIGSLGVKTRLRDYIVLSLWFKHHFQNGFVKIEVTVTNWYIVLL